MKGIVCLFSWNTVILQPRIKQHLQVVGNPPPTSLEGTSPNNHRHMKRS